MSVVTAKVPVSREPVFTSGLDVVGYELKAPGFDFTEGGSAALYESLTSGGIEEIVGDHLAFMPLTPGLLADDLWRSIPPSTVVFSLPDGDLPDALSDSISALLSEGYSFILPDSTSGQLEGPDSPQHIVKLDVTRYTPDELETRVQMLRQSSVRIAADKLDTYDDVEFSKSLGADLYRGRFLWKPAVKQEEIPANRLTMVRALSKLQDPEISMDELEEVISQDVALSYRILRYVNSAAAALASDVTSIGHAVRLVGVNRLRSWASVLLLSSVADKPLELMRTSLIRGRMCELLATSLRHSEADSCFTAGLFSALDALLDCPMKQVMKDLPLSPDIQSGILEGSGVIGQTLRCTLAYEWGAWDDVQAYGRSEGISVDRMRDCYMDAIHWSDGVLAEAVD